jgi:hypothetical protein
VRRLSRGVSPSLPRTGPPHPFVSGGTAPRVGWGVRGATPSASDGNIHIHVSHTKPALDTAGAVLFVSACCCCIQRVPHGSLLVLDTRTDGSPPPPPTPPPRSTRNEGVGVSAHPSSSQEHERSRTGSLWRAASSSRSRRRCSIGAGEGGATSAEAVRGWSGTRLTSLVSPSTERFRFVLQRVPHRPRLRREPPARRVDGVGPAYIHSNFDICLTQP